MAGITIKVGNTEITFEGTPEELVEIARKFNEGKSEEPAQTIEGPVRVGDTIEITEARRGLTHYTVGRRYHVVGTSREQPKVIDDDGDETTVILAKYRIVARKEEAPTPARPSAKVGDYIVFDEELAYITAGKPYLVEDVDDDGNAWIDDDEDDYVKCGSCAPADYRIITDARELAFAKAGRKLDEFKAGDIARAKFNGRIIEVSGIKSSVSCSIRFHDKNFGDNGYCPEALELIAPAESRVDGE